MSQWFGTIKAYFYLRSVYWRVCKSPPSGGPRIYQFPICGSAILWLQDYSSVLAADGDMRLFTLTYSLLNHLDPNMTLCPFIALARTCQMPLCRGGVGLGNGSLWLRSLFQATTLLTVEGTPEPSIVN